MILGKIYFTYLLTLLTRAKLAMNILKEIKN